MSSFFINKICGKCGANITEKYSLCPNCGELLRSENNSVSGNTSTKSLSSKVLKNRLLSAMSYIGFLVFIPLCIRKERNTNRFHINQGLSLLLCEIVYFLLYLLASTVLVNIPMWLYCLTAVMLSAMVIFAVYGIIGFISALMGENRQLPIIGSVRILK